MRKGLGFTLDPTGAGAVTSGVASIFQTLNAPKLAKEQAKIQKAEAAEAAKSRNFWMYLLIGAGAIVVATVVVKSATKKGK